MPITLSYRLFVSHLESDADFDRLLRFLKKHRKAIDELSLFTEYWHHAYYPLDRFSELAAILGRRIAQLRKEGFSKVGINMLDTTGHLDEAWDFLPPLPFQPVVGHDGVLSRSCACANTPAFEAYILEKYRLIARQRPDFIWIDDDVRLKNKGVPFPCFCSTCLELFARQEDVAVPARTDLIRKLNMPAGQSWRERWVRFNGRTLERLLRKIARVVREVNPKIELGFMSGPLSTEGGLASYSGLKIPRALQILGASKLRPGGGFYDDERPRLMVGKALIIAEQCRDLPARVDDIQYELENFPYQKLSKSVTTVLNECTLALASGCNGIAFNALKDLPGSFEDYDDLLVAIQRRKMFWKMQSEACVSTASAGLYCAFDSRLATSRTIDAKGWFQPPRYCDVSEVYSWAQLGLPLCSAPEHSSATLLAGCMAEAYSNRELRNFLREGLIIDAEALAVLWKRGLGPLTGVKPGKAYDNGVLECFTDHALNGPYVGEKRDARISFWPTRARELISCASGAEQLAELIGYDGRGLGSSLNIFENELGGRVVVLGYSPWSHLNSSAKRFQILELADWVSRKTLPLRIDRTLRVTPFVRTSLDGKRLVAVLLNTGFDETGKFRLRLRGAFSSVSRLSNLGQWENMPVSITEAETVVTVTNLPVWQVMVLKAESSSKSRRNKRELT